MTLRGAYHFGSGDGKLVVASAPYKDLSFLTGAGSVYATAEDLLHFANAARAGIRRLTKHSLLMNCNPPRSNKHLLGDSGDALPVV